MGFKVFSLRLLHTNIFFHTYFENTEQEKRKNISILWFFFSLSVLRFSSTSDSLCPHTSIPPLRIDLEDRTVQIADL